MSQATEIVKAELLPSQDAGVVLMPVMNIAAAKQRLAEFQEFVKGYLVPNEDYGTIPGTPKPTLLKPGADKLCDIYGLADSYTWKEVENWQLDPPLFDYTVTCTLVARRDQRFIGSGVGSCNSWEAKYRWRDTKRKCPLCGKEAIIKGKEDWGGGWTCWKKRDGCGAKFLDGDKAIEDQLSGRAPNEDIADQKNTILKMAKKRAKIDAVISVTRSSGIFTQDMEDHLEPQGPEDGQGTKAAAQRVAEKKIAEAKPQKAKTNGHTAPSAEKCLFYVLPTDYNGHYYEFVNMTNFQQSLNQVAAQGLIETFKPYMATINKDRILIPSGKMDALLEELSEMHVPAHKLEAR